VPVCDDEGVPGVDLLLETCVYADEEGPCRVADDEVVPERLALAVPVVRRGGRAGVAACWNVPVSLLLGVGACGCCSLCQCATRRDVRVRPGRFAVPVV